MFVSKGFGSEGKGERKEKGPKGVRRRAGSREEGRSRGKGLALAAK